MNKTCKAAIGTAVLAIGLGASTAQGAFITGSITVADGLLGLPAAPSGSAVSALTGIQPDGNGTAFGCSTDFVGSCGFQVATMTDWNFVGPFPDIIVVNGFTFDLTSIGAITPDPLSCGGGSCSDGLLVASLVGVVSKAGFDPTAFTGSLSFSGSCVGSGTTCTSDIGGGYSYSLSATGKSTVPEPGTLLLIGVALAGLGLVLRKKT